MAQKTVIYRLTPILMVMGACTSAKAWLADYNYPTFAEAWGECRNSDWLLWLLQHTPSTTNQDLVRLGLALREASKKATAFPFDAAYEDYNLTRVLTDWCDGNASIDEVVEAQTIACKQRNDFTIVRSYEWKLAQLAQQNPLYRHIHALHDLAFFASGHALDVPSMIREHF
jgi:hypothetical protein